MSRAKDVEIGAINWVDLTVEPAEKVRDFYKAVVGWTSGECDMGGYSDYFMNLPGNGRTVAGVCHARGPNSDLPAQWLVYITVADVDASAVLCVELGGEIIAGPRDMGHQGRFCVLRDPAGAVAALFTPAK